MNDNIDASWIESHRIMCRVAKKHTITEIKDINVNINPIFFIIFWPSCLFLQSLFIKTGAINETYFQMYTIFS